MPGPGDFLDPNSFTQKMWDLFGVLPGQGRSFYGAPQSTNQRVQDTFDALPQQASPHQINPSLQPLFMQSGMMQAPPQGRTAPSDLDMNDPFARAAYRQQQSVQPDFGRAGEGPSIAGVAASAMPGGMFTRAATAAPKTMAAVLGLTGLGASASEAGEQPFKWDDPNTARMKRLAEIDKEMKDLSTRKTPSAPGTQAKRIDVLTTEQNKLLEERGTEYNNAFAQYQQTQTDARAAAAEKKRANTSWFDMLPGTRTAMTLGLLPLSYVGGRIAGAKLPPAKAIPAAAAIEGGIGALGQYIPTEVDMGLPRDAPARQQAAQDLTDPEYWKRLGIMGGANAGLATVGAAHKWMSRLPALGSILSRSERGPTPSAPAPMVPTSPTVGGGPSIPGMMSAPSTLPSAAALPSPSPALAPVFSKKSGRWHDPSTGNFVRAPSASPPPLMGE